MKFAAKLCPRSWREAVSLVFLAVGLALIGYVASQYWGMYSGQRRLQAEWQKQMATAANPGLPPLSEAEMLTRVSIPKINLDAIAASTQRTGYPVAGLVKELGRVAGEDAAKFIHLGATSQDILDTALVLQIRGAL